MKYAYYVSYFLALSIEIENNNAANQEIRQ